MRRRFRSQQVQRVRPKWIETPLTPAFTILTPAAPKGVQRLAQSVTLEDQLSPKAKLERILGRVWLAATLNPPPMECSLSVDIFADVGITVLDEAAVSTSSTPDPGDDDDARWLWRDRVYIQNQWAICESTIGPVTTVSAGNQTGFMGTSAFYQLPVDIRVKRRLQPDEELAFFVLGTSNGSPYGTLAPGPPADNLLFASWFRQLYTT